MFVRNLMFLLVSLSCFGGGQVWKKGNAHLNLGIGFRVTAEQHHQNNEEEIEFELESIRLYFNGQLLPGLTFELNLDKHYSEESARLIDGLVKLRINQALNLKLGRFIPPSDRSNLSGPYFLGFWHFPMVQRYPNLAAGRDEGIAAWGQTGGGEFTWQAGLFDGFHESNKPLFTSRLAYNFLDPEPGYYTSSTYYGSKDILALGAVFMKQKMPDDRLDFTAGNVDLLFEKKMPGNHALTLESAWYDYESESDLLQPQGDGLMVLAAWLFPPAYRSGRFRFAARNQHFDDPKYGEEEHLAFALDYILRGHDARISLTHTRIDSEFSEDFDHLNLGIQIQF